MPFYAADGARKGSNNSVSFKIAEDGKDRTMHGPAYGFGRLSSSQRLEIPRPRKSKESGSIEFSDVPINSGVEFHFILAFAIGYTRDNHPSPANGKFNVFWETKNLGPCQVEDILGSKCCFFTH
ncbi:hypothetical protein V6N13_038195 [Hibiscus sabdariffa]